MKKTTAELALTALKNCADSAEVHDAIAALELDIAQAVEPVAQWQKKHPARTHSEWENTNEHDAKWWRDNSCGWEIRALYTAPQEPAAPDVNAELLKLLKDASDALGGIKLAGISNDTTGRVIVANASISEAIAKAGGAA